MKGQIPAIKVRMVPKTTFVSAGIRPCNAANPLRSSRVAAESHFTTLDIVSMRAERKRPGKTKMADDRGIGCAAMRFSTRKRMVA